MGLFSSKKKVYVSSVVYNLAGDENKRPNYLKTTVVGAVIANKPSIAGAVNDSYLDGPGIRFRNFARWARNSGYNDLVGWATGNLTSGTSINNSALAVEIPHAVGETVTLQDSVIGAADFGWWADQYVAENFPERLNTDYVSDYNEDTGVITITWADQTITVFNPANYDVTARYLYAVYMLASGRQDGPVVPGSDVILAPGESFPSVAGWDEVSYSAIPTVQSLDTVTTMDVVYSDSTPPEHSETTTSEDETYNLIQGEYTKVSSISSSGSMATKTETMYLSQTGTVTQTTTTNTVEEDIGGGVIKTTTTTVVQDVLSLVRQYRIDTQESTLQSWSNLKIFIYKQGDGNAVLDNMFNAHTPVGQFFPFIPYRIDNEFVSTRWPDDVYPQVKKAFNKATGGKYDSVQESIADNSSLGDIDYAYAVFGVSLNVKENACKKYIFKFFEYITEDPSLQNKQSFEDWKIQWQAAEDSLVEWAAWRDRNKYNEYWNPAQDPEPEVKPYPQVPTNSIRVSSDNWWIMNYDITLSWNYVEKLQYTGEAWAGAKTGELRIIKGDTESFNQLVWAVDEYGDEYLIPSRAFSADTVLIQWQTSATTYRVMRLIGLHHRNLIYKGKSVDITGHEALDDADESGFIIPLHEQIYRNMGIKDGTQMSTACCFMVFNCYEVVKQKWYQTGIFQVIVVVAIIVISIYSGGSGAGLLGASASVGASLGFTGLAAIIVGSVANALAAMILMQIIQMGAVALFGDKIGAIVSTIVSIVAIQVGTSLMNGGSLATSFNGLLKADNILRLTSSVGNGVSQYMSAAAAEYMQKTEDLMTQYNVDSKAIQTAWEQNLGYSQGIIDPMMLTDVASLYQEPVDTFLSRTLLTGSEVAEMSIEMLSKFAETTLSTQLV